MSTGQVGQWYSVDVVIILVIALAVEKKTARSSVFDSNLRFIWAQNLRREKYEIFLKDSWPTQEL